MGTTTLIALLLLAPLPGPDAAPPTFQVPVNSRVVAPDGRIWTFSGTLTVTVEDAPPVPPGPQITALRNAAGQGVEQIRAGEVLVIEGVGLTKPGAQIRVQIPGHRATVLSMSPTKLEVRFLPLQASITGPLQVYHYTGTGWTLVTTGPRFTVLPAAPLPPGRPIIRSFSNPILKGEGFGTAPGRVRVLGAESVPVLSWDDREVRISVAPGSPWYGISFVLERADGEWTSFSGEVR